MTFFSKHRIVFSLTVAAILVVLAVSAMFWARGFKLNFNERKLERTGLLIANSTPTGAEIFLDDRLTSATNTTIAYLEPKTYQIKIQKDGYTTWEKDVEIKEDLSTELNVLLFPLAPEIKPLTSTGSVNPTLSPDGTKIAFAASGERGGLYMLTMNTTPLPFRQDTKLLSANTASFDYTNASFVWSPDSKEIVARFKEDNVVVANLLVDTNQSNQQPRDITATLLATVDSWQTEIDAKAQTQAIIAPDDVKNATTEAQPESDPSPSPITTSSSADSQINRQNNNLLNYYPTGMIFSPDEERILYKNIDGDYKVYNLKTKREFTLPQFDNLQNISWYSTSNHLIVAQENLISIIEADGTNIISVFSGKFVNGFVFSHPGGNRLVILTALTQPEDSLPNLYSISLK